jgi:ATP-dependent DNA helicase DinG
VTLVAPRLVLVEPISTFAQAEEALAQSLPGYESRPQQQALAQAVEAALASGVHLVGEAGCGTGKSLGYLIPAILSGRRTIVSTATKALQDQIAAKDLPFLAEHLGVPFTHAVLKGRSNYYCRLKADEAEPTEVPVIIQMRGQVEAEGFTGERDSFTGIEIRDADWRKVTSSADECPGKSECVYGKNGCFAEEAKSRAQDASVVVVNHALLFTDLVVKAISDGKASMIGEYDAVVFDEAHEIEEYASGIFGSQFSEGSVRRLLTEVRNFAAKVPGASEDVQAQESEVLGALTALWMVLEPGRIREVHLSAAEEEYVGLALALQKYEEVVRGIDLDRVAPVEYEQFKSRKARLVKRTGKTAASFTDVVAASFASLVRWVEVEKRNYRGTATETKVIKTAPIDISDILDRMLFESDDRPTCILVSATMSTGGTFDYITKRLGLRHYQGIDVGTPFDYQKQSALYVPRHLPDPAKERQAWQSMSISEMGDLVKASSGRALLLFTSTQQMRNAYDLLEPRLPYRCLMQGQGSNKSLAEEFMADTHSVLFATRSFFTGVDFQGEACSLVVIDKLPFPVPTEALTEARCDAIVARGGNDFGEYTIPVMSLILKQGFGRLIRHRNDRGVVAILDPRLLTKGYGKQIVRSLPDATLLEKPEQVRAFFDALA